MLQLDHQTVFQPFQEEVFQRLRSSEQELLDLALNATTQIEKCCSLAASLGAFLGCRVQPGVQPVQGMSCLPAFPKMDTASVKPLVLLLCFWLRYIAVSADEDDVSPVCMAVLPLVGTQMLWFQPLWKNQNKGSTMVPSCSFLAQWL